MLWIASAIFTTLKAMLTILVLSMLRIIGQVMVHGLIHVLRGVGVSARNFRLRTEGLIMVLVLIGDLEWSYML